MVIILWVYETGTRIWYVNETLHRVNAPAIVWNNDYNDIEYWVEGTKIYK